jgi:hypothetical protein
MGRVLLERVMYPVIVVVGDVIADQPPQMGFVQCNDVVQDLAAAASDPALRNPVLPRCPNTGALRLQAGCLQEGDHSRVEFGVVVKDNVSIVTSPGKRFTELLNDPIGGRMTSDVEVQDLAPAVFDHEETIQKLESQSRQGEEIKSDVRFSVIGQERQPAFGRIAAMRRVRRRYLATVRSETSKPSFRSSPWILGAPQSEFSVAIVRMRVRISSLILGRPPQDRDRHRQYRRKPTRCHRITVSGFTMTKTSDHRGQMFRRVVQNKRSRRLREGRRRLRLSTATCCRSARISSEVSRRLRKKTRKAARTAGIKSSTNQRCNTGQQSLAVRRCKIANCGFL